MTTIPRFIDPLGDNVWSGDDIDNRARAWVASDVSEARQNELRTIMLGHISGMRPATAKEMGEIMLVKARTEEAGLRILEARTDMALLHAALAVEAAQMRLAVPAAVEGDEADAAARTQAQAAIDAADQPTLDLVVLRAASRMPPVTPEGAAP